VGNPVLGRAIAKQAHDKAMLADGNFRQNHRKG